MSAMTPIYFLLVKKGLKDISEVPQHLIKDVKKMMDEDNAK